MQILPKKYYINIHETKVSSETPHLHTLKYIIAQILKNVN